MADDIRTPRVPVSLAVRWRRVLRTAAMATMWVVSASQAMDEPPVAASVCAGCHGLDGVSANPHVPSLAGQPYTLIEDNLVAFRGGLRACSKERLDDSVAGSLSQAMCFQVGQLGDGEIEELAKWFEAQAFVPVEQPFDPEQAAAGAALHRQLGCERCHARGGRETLGMAPVLAGQWTPFLRRSLGAIRNGTRRGPAMMNEPIRRLGDDEIEALLHFYASMASSTP